MNLSEYKEWLKENAYIEEQKAYEVVEKIIKHHKSEYSETDAKLFPRKVIVSKKERIEFDLIIKLTFNGKRRTTERLIGVEFKEYDIKKVIHQAIVRRPYVNYMYIATRPATIDYFDLFLLSAYSIGWIWWDEDIVKILIPSRYALPHPDFYAILDRILEQVIREKVREKLSTLNRFFKEGDSDGEDH